MAEFEELRIKLTLIGDAATGIALLNTSLAGLNNTVSKQIGPQLTLTARGIAQVSQETKNLQTRIRSTVGDFSNVVATVGQIGQGVGLIGRMPLAIGGIVGIIAGINAALVQFSQRMLDLRGKAQAAGLVPDQFMNISLQLQKFGASAEEAEADIISFHRTVREANKGGTAEFNRIFSEARDPDNVVRFVNYLQELINSGQSEKAIALAAERARKIFDRELNRTGGNRAEATRQAESFLGLIGLTLRALEVGELAPFDNSTKWQERVDMAAKFWVEWTKVLKTLDEIVSGIQKELLPSFTELNQALAGLGKGWGETIGASIATTLREIKALLAAWNWFTGRGESSGGGLPGLLGRLFGGGSAGTGAPWDPRAPYRREGTTAPGAATQPPAAPGGDIFSDRFGIWPGGGSKPIGSDVGPGYGAGAFGVPSSGVLSGGAGGLTGREGYRPYTSSRSPRLQGLINTNPAVKDALQIPRLPGESDRDWIARGRRALEATGAGKISYQARRGAAEGEDEPRRFRPEGRGEFTPGGLPLRPLYRGRNMDDLPLPEPGPTHGAGAGRFGGGYLGGIQEEDWKQRIKEATEGRSYSEKQNAPGPSQWEGGMLPVPGELKNLQRGMHEKLWERYRGPQYFDQPRGEAPSPEDLAPWNQYSGVNPTAPISLDRSMLDRSMGAPLVEQNVKGTGNVDVTITDGGSKVEASGGGMFEGNVETTKERVMGL